MTPEDCELINEFMSRACDGDINYVTNHIKSISHKDYLETLYSVSCNFNDDNNNNNDNKQTYKQNLKKVFELLVNSPKLNMSVKTLKTIEYRYGKDLAGDVLSAYRMDVCGYHSDGDE